MKSQPLLQPIGWGTAILMATATLVTGAVSTYVVLHQQSRAQTDASSVSSATPKTSSPAVAALGYLEPQGEVIEISAPSSGEGSRVERLTIERGDKVKKGQIIAILDNYNRLAASLQQARVEVVVARSRLNQVKAGAKKGEILAQQAKFQGSKAELEGQMAMQKAIVANLQAQLKGEKSAQEATIGRIQAELANARTDCLRYQSLYQQGAVAAIVRDTNCLEQETSQKLLQEARANLDLIVTSRAEQIQQAKANLDRTLITQQKQIQEAEATLEALSEVRSVDVEVALSEVETALAAVSKAEADLNLACVRSPRDGQILKINTLPGETIGDRGIVELGQTDRMYVRAEVYETDISRVSLGQKAIVKSNGIVPDLQGIVDEIGLQIGKKDILGTDPAADADARVVEVKIRLTPKDSQLVADLTNLQVSVAIDTSSQPKNRF